MSTEAELIQVDEALLQRIWTKYFVREHAYTKIEIALY